METQIMNLYSKLSAKVLFAAVVVQGLGACAGGQQANVPQNPTDFAAPSATTPLTAVPSAPRPLESGDSVRVTVFQEAELSGEFRIDPSGRIDFPLLGPVQAQGLLPEQLASALRTQLGGRYLRDPRVHVAVSESVQRTITVDGAVGQPGVFPIREPITLIQAIALARGTNQRASEDQVLVFRNIEGRRMAAAFDLRSIRRAETEDPTIYPNDIVVVLDSRRRAIFQDVLQALPIFAIFRPF